jgi:hypothetical protein
MNKRSVGNQTGGISQIQILDSKENKMFIRLTPCYDCVAHNTSRLSILIQSGREVKVTCRYNEEKCR